MSEVIYEGLIATHKKAPVQAQITISKDTGLITNVIENKEEFKENDNIIKINSDCLIFPGMYDIHIHAREDETKGQNHKETYQTAGDAAINGGVIGIAAMPNTPNPLTTSEQLKWHQNRTKEIKHPATFLNYVGVGPTTKPLVENVPYKAFTGPSVGDLFFKSEKELRNTLQHYKGLPISFHVEDFDVLAANENENNHSTRRPVECVEVALKYVLQIIEDYDLNAKLCHWSTGLESFNMIKKHREIMAKKNLGYNTTIEVSPLHLTFDSNMLEKNPEFWPYVQMNPAIQNKEHRHALIDALKEGFIDFIATDHAPHTISEKFKNFNGSEEEFYKLLKENPEETKLTCCENGMSGATWLDTYVNICGMLMTKHNFSSMDIARVTAYNPGKFVNSFLDSSYGKGFGKIEVGYQGSLTIMNIEKEELIVRENLKTKPGYSPLEGLNFKGRVEKVIVKGEDVTIQKDYSITDSNSVLFKLRIKDGINVPF